jgi:hypothetical protein
MPIMKSFYDIATQLLTKIFSQATIIKFGFNLSPMYRRTTARVTDVSDDVHRVSIKIPLSYKNKNYVGTIFGGSLFAATDPVYMIQLIYILGNDYVVWDKSTYIRFKRPANKDAYVEFIFTPEEIDKIKADVALQGEIDVVKPLEIVSKEGIVFAQLEKTIYISSKEFYKQKQAQRKKLK